MTDRELLIEELDKLRIPCAPVLSLNEAMEHPHLRSRGTVRKVKDAVLGEFDIPGFPVKFSRWEISKDLKAHSLGADNADVLKEYLHLSDQEIKNLYDEKVLLKELDS
jgi:CoA:oxalate CoA-transferase